MSRICPLVDALIDDLESCLAESGVGEPVEVLVGDYPSPTLLFDGIDAATGVPDVTERGTGTVGCHRHLEGCVPRFFVRCSGRWERARAPPPAAETFWAPGL